MKGDKQLLLLFHMAHKNKFGNNFSVVGILRKLSYMVSASKHHNSEYFWKVVHDAEKKATTYNNILDISSFVDYVYIEIKLIEKENI